MDVQIKWFIRRHMAEMLDIEWASFNNPWWEEDFLCCLRQRNCIGMVAECDHRIVGFMIYELHKSKLRVLNFAVHPEFRRQSVGRQMVKRLLEKLSQQRRKEIVLDIRETNLSGQQFFHSQGFRATQVFRGHYEDTGEDAYEMSYRLDGHNQRYGHVPVNRISHIVT